MLSGKVLFLVGLAIGADSFAPSSVANTPDERAGEERTGDDTPDERASVALPMEASMYDEQRASAAA